MSIFIKHFVMLCIVTAFGCAFVGAVNAANKADNDAETPTIAGEVSPATNTAPNPVALVSLIAGEPVNIAGYIWAVPVLGKNVEQFLRLTGWKLMIEGNGLDSSSEEWLERGVKVAVMSEGTDKTRQKPQFWSAYHGQMERVGEEWVVHLFFWAGDPNKS